MGSRATGVAALLGGKMTTFHADEVVVSAGAVHSPAILQRSGIGSSAHLRSLGIDVRNDVPVGEGFQEHPHVYFGFGVAPDLTAPVNGRHTNACVRWTSDLDATGGNDLMAIVNGPAPGMPDVAGLGLWVNQPFSRGLVRIVSSDPCLDPAIEMGLATDQRDRARLRSLVEAATDVLGQPSFTKMRTSDPSGIDGTPLAALGRATHAEIDAWIDAVVDGSAHASATCALGSVVDGECRVLGVDSLRVADLSIVPSVPRANTNLTAIMIGERVATLMRDAR